MSVSPDHEELVRQANAVMYDFEQRAAVYSAASFTEDPAELRRLALEWMAWIDATEAKLLDFAERFTALAARTTDLSERVVLLDEVRLIQDWGAEIHKLCQLPPR